jgi:OTU domain-containing protein 6
MEELLAKHRKELRDLQNRITSQKKQATKKTRKSVNEACENLEKQTKERQAREIEALQNGGTAPADDEKNEATNGDANENNDNVYVPPPSDSEDDEPTKNDTTPDDVPPIEKLSISPVQGGKKPNRQKARLARRAAEAAAASEAAALEAQSLPKLREREMATMEKLFATHGLTEHQIAPDGHCLYSAFTHSLRTAGLELEEMPKDYKEARKSCAEFMKGHRDDFEAFLEEDFDTHVKNVEGTAEWGGQTEVLALGRAFNVKVNILQAEGRGVEKMNEDGDKGEVWLGYYRHSFGLGEHYNSLVKKA